MKNIKENAIIRKVTINNIQIDKKNTAGNIEIYRPSMGTKLYDYKEMYEIKDSYRIHRSSRNIFKSKELSHFK